MNYGRLCKTKLPKFGSGLRWSAKPAGLLALPSATVPNRPAVDYGSRCQPIIANVPSATPIFGMPMPVYCQANGIVPWARKQVRRRTSSASTTHSDNAVLISCVKRSHSAKIFTGMKLASTSSLIITTNNLSVRVVFHQFRLCHYRCDNISLMNTTSLPLSISTASSVRERTIRGFGQNAMLRIC